MDEVMEIRKAIEELKAADVSQIADKVAATGFKCKRCGKCCSGRFGDNTVTVFPSEIRDIMGATGLDWLDIAVPHESRDFDEEGRCHTFEWALRKKGDGDCIFLEDGRCMIYECRPFICRTYPFRLDIARMEVESYECDGLGSGGMDEASASSMAKALMERAIAEATEAVSLLEKYEPFRPGRPIQGRQPIYIVHDSEGSRKVRIGDDGASFA
ncbi:YkgJ family cysteine cluster protein [Methanocella conradii]|uniref:YkgJ family cysteine cluster protein n=1 Tax=Methanocella conradii TaxID=1175444 RepID=UPI0020C7211C|nr:YkgJ family cysteine cluster protein [Methanocella conradii]